MASASTGPVCLAPGSPSLPLRFPRVQLPLSLGERHGKEEGQERVLRGQVPPQDGELSHRRVLKVVASVLAARGVSWEAVVSLMPRTRRSLSVSVVGPGCPQVSLTGEHCLCCRQRVRILWLSSSSLKSPNADGSWDPRGGEGGPASAASPSASPHPPEGFSQAVRQSPGLGSHSCRLVSRGPGQQGWSELPGGPQCSQIRGPPRSLS